MYKLFLLLFTNILYARIELKNLEKRRGKMKYLKYSIILLVCAAAVSRVTVGKSINKTKNTYTNQKFKVQEETQEFCKNFTYTAYPVAVDGEYHYRARGKIEIGEISTMQSDSYNPGDYFIEFYRDDIMLIATKKNGLFTYDPNNLFLK